MRLVIFPFSDLYDNNLSIYLFQVSQRSRDQTWNVIPRSLGEALGVSNGKNIEVTDPRSVMHKAIHSMAPSLPHSADHFRDPAEYHHAKRKLRKAIQEFYRNLELLNDYRVRFLIAIPVIVLLIDI